MTIVARGYAFSCAICLCNVLTGCDSLRLTATKTSLGVGESVRVEVVRKVAWFLTGELIDAKTSYYTTSELCLVVEPDGTVTCVGTYGRSRESAWIGALNGESKGHIAFELSPVGPGPTLDVGGVSSVQRPASPYDKFGPCCSIPLFIREGEQVKYSVRVISSGQDVTSCATGTRYTLFYGSGFPNDPHPERITGSDDLFTALNLRIDDRKGQITAPHSIRTLNYESIIVFVRNGAMIGWRELVIVHGRDGSPIRRFKAFRGSTSRES